MLETDRVHLTDPPAVSSFVSDLLGNASNGLAVFALGNMEDASTL
jgi:hypothetical protein